MHPSIYRYKVKVIQYPIPDSTAPLPGAEVLVLGPVGPVSEEPSRARLAVSGGFDVELVLRSDATDSSPGSTVRADFARAVLHPEHNPQGRDPDEGLTIDSESFVLLLAEHLKVEHVLTKNCSIHLT